jgi:DNA-binding GntR family transcriptional regulator
MSNRTRQLDTAHANAVVRFAPIHDQILPHLRKDIVENRWKSGERLSEPLLCREFGVSRTPLRQVLKTLESEGLIRLVPHVGAVVTNPDATDVGETMEILIGLEQLAVTRVAQARPAEVLRDIERIYKEMKQAAKRLDAKLYYELNDQFHRTIVRGTGNRSLMDLHEKIMWHVHRERHRVNETESVTVESAESHDDIVHAIRAGKPEQAGRAMRLHLENISELMLTRRKQEMAESVLPARSPAPARKPKARQPRGKGKAARR